MESSSCVVLANTHSNGRFANQFFRAMAAHFISKNLNISAEYPFDINDFLGIKLNSIKYLPRMNSHKNTIKLTEDDFMKYINKTVFLKDNTVLDLNNIYCQTKEFALKIHDFVNEEEVKHAIVSKNKYALQDNSNALFVHVRLGDVINKNPGLNYYKKVLSTINFNVGYIASDTIDHPICKELITQFKLTPIMLNEMDTIQFGSMCKHIVLSNGTFSWLTGLLGFSSDVYWPEIKQNWHGDIYDCMPNWKKISYVRM
jgi:hypothetical protein